MHYAYFHFRSDFFCIHFTSFILTYPLFVLVMWPFIFIVYIKAELKHGAKKGKQTVYI